MVLHYSPVPSLTPCFRSVQLGEHLHASGSERLAAALAFRILPPISCSQGESAIRTGPPMRQVPQTLLRQTRHSMHGAHPSLDVPVGTLRSPNGAQESCDAQWLRRQQEDTVDWSGTLEVLSVMGGRPLCAQHRPPDGRSCRPSSRCCGRTSNSFAHVPASESDRHALTHWLCRPSQPNLSPAQSTRLWRRSCHSAAARTCRVPMRSASRRPRRLWRSSVPTYVVQSHRIRLYI
jgi:hypothetical protein